MKYNKIYFKNLDKNKMNPQNNALNPTSVTANNQPLDSNWVNAQVSNGSPQTSIANSIDISSSLESAISQGLQESIQEEKQNTQSQEVVFPTKKTNDKKIDDRLIELTKKPADYLKYLLSIMIKTKASDMYLTLNESPVVRVFEQLHRIDQLPIMDIETLDAVGYQFLSDFEWERFRENLDIDVGYSYGWRRFRINISRQQKSVMIVIRLLAEKIPTLTELWLPPIFFELINKRSWIIILAWPTGSWKSTTLAAMIEEINSTMWKHIITIEDPIEYVFEPKKSVVEQKQLWTDILTFPKALRSALRQKPDVILFWEMRDLESIQNAITLAETGHLVLTTIHSKSASQTINKIIDAFHADQQNQIRIQLSETLLSIISQRLINKLDWSWVSIALEIMINTPAVANLIRENQTGQINNIIQTWKQHSMKLLEEDLQNLVDNKQITFEEALSNANLPKLLSIPQQYIDSFQE